MMTFNKEQFLQLQESKEFLKGYVRGTENECKLFGEDVIWFEHEAVKVYIPRSEISVRQIKRSLITFVGETITYVIKEVSEDGTYVVGSIKEVEQMRREALVKRVTENPDLEFEGTIRYIEKYGAYVDVAGVSVLLTNQDFAEDYTTIRDVHKHGDKIRIKVSKIMGNKIIFEAVEKYRANSNIGFDDFEEKQVVVGTVRDVKPQHLFVCLAPNLDALAPIPEWFEVREGDKVQFLIGKIMPEQKRIRGKVTKVLAQ